MTTGPSSGNTKFERLLTELARTPDVQPVPVFRGTARYRLLRRLGEGGSGVVYEVQDAETDRRLALKLLKDSRAEQVEWLKKEFRTVANLVHPNLVALHALVCEECRWFITMDLVEGVDFLAYTDTRRVSDPGDAEGAAVTVPSFARLRNGLRQLAEGVAAIHREGKLHGDLKPSNVLVDTDGRVVILDFGLAHDVRGELMTLAPHNAGTPEYMAPEQLNGAPPSQASDCYAVGVMLYQALAGELPCQGSWSELARVKQQHNPAPPSTRDADIPQDLQALCMQLLRRDPGQRPSALEILEQLEAEPQRRTRFLAGTVGNLLIGRGPVLRELDESFRRVVGGRPATIFVHGEPGIGKTAACEHFLVRVRTRREALVLPARCYEREAVPFNAADGVVSTLATVLQERSRAELAALMPRDFQLLARLFPVLETVPILGTVATPAAETPDPQASRRRAFAALKDLLRPLAKERPLVIFIDDLQWGDIDSAHLLSELLGPPDPPTLLFIGCYRTGAHEHSEALQLLLRDPSGAGQYAPVIHLEGLNPEDATELALTLSGGVPDRNGIDQIVLESRGHPLFIAELLHERATVREGATSVHDLIAKRIARLESDVRSLLEVVAIAGQPLTRHVCLEAAGLRGVGPTAIRLLTAGRLLRTSGQHERDWLEPYHDRVREAVTSAINPEGARAHHIALALALQRAGGDPETLADHFDAGGDALRGGRYAAIAADSASDALAFDRAAKLYQRALERLDPSGSERAALLEKLGRTLANAGRGADAGRTLLAASEAALGDTRDLRRRAAEQLLVSGREAEGLAVLRPLLDELGIGYPATTGRAVAQVIWTSIRLSRRDGRFRERHEHELSRELLLRLDVLESAGRGLEFHDLWRAISFFNRFALLALKAGEPRRGARAMANLIPLHALKKGMDGRARRTAASALALACRLEDADALSSVYRQMGVALGYMSGLWREAVDNLARADRVLVERCTANLRDVRYCRMKTAQGLLRLGRLHELTLRCDPQLRDAIDRGDHLAKAALQIFAKAPLFLASDQPQAARRVLGATTLPSTGVFRLYHACTLSDAYLYDGDAAAACAAWKDWWPEYRKAQLTHMPLFKLDATRSYALALAAFGDEVSLKLARKLAETLNADHVMSSRATREAILACVAARRGPAAHVAKLLASAAAGFAEAEMTLYAAACRRALGVLTGQTHLVDEADAVMRAEGIVRPDRWAAMYVPMPP